MTNAEGSRSGEDEEERVQSGDEGSSGFRLQSVTFRPSSDSVRVTLRCRRRRLSCVGSSAVMLLTVLAPEKHHQPL